MLNAVKLEKIGGDSKVSIHLTNHSYIRKKIIHLSLDLIS